MARPKKPWILPEALQPFVAKLGQLSDYEVAQLAQIGQSTVFDARKKLGIAPRGRIPPNTWRPSPKIQAQLGKQMDSVLAREAGVDIARIRLFRVSLGIAAYQRPPKA